MIEGSKVVCVNDNFSASVHQVYQQLPVKGGHYTIRAVYLGRGMIAVWRDGKLVPNAASTASGGEVGLLLKELVNPPDPLCSQRELGFNAERFAPLEEQEDAAGGEQEPEVLTVPGLAYA